MSRVPGPIGAHPESDRIQVLMTPGRDRDLLAEWLRGLRAYEVTIGDPAAELPPEPQYDLCIVDVASLADVRDDLRAHRRAVDPTLLPCLLVHSETGTDTPGNTPGNGSAAVPDGESDVVTDSVSLPVDKTVLRRRIENLLRSRRAFLELRMQERQYERLVDLTPEALVVVRGGDIAYANSTAVTMFGADAADDLEGRPVTELVAANAESDLTDVLTDIRAGSDGDGTSDLAMETVPGERLLTEVSGVEVVFDGETAVQLLVRDVTDRHERKQRLELFDRAIQTAIQGVSIADARQPDNPLIYVNETFERITGYPAGEVLGKNCRFLQGERTDEETVARLREAIDAGEAISVDIRNYRKDGTPFWNQIDVMPVTDEDGAVTHFLGLQADITDRKAREERLQVLSRVLRHNLRNSMTIIQGHGEELASSDDPETAAAARQITTEATELLRVTERIQEFDSIVSASDGTVESHDVTAVLRAAVADLRAEYPDADVEFDPGEGTTVSGHELLPTALEEFLRIPMHDGLPGDVTVTVESDDDWVTIELHDEGETTAQRDLQAIEQNAETTVDHPDGVGLWMVLWAVQYSDGELSVLRDGTPRIRVRLPRASKD